MQADFIQLINLTLRVASQTLLDRVYCTIREGEFVAIIGANGVGKSSLLRLLGGLLKPTRGKLLVPTPNEIGYAPDVAPLYPYDTVEGYLRFISVLKHASDDHFTECLQALDLEAVRNKKIITLSKGTQQRINIAQALINRPKLLLLDEATNGLDDRHCHSCCEYLKFLQKLGTTIIIASHQYSDFVQSCDYMLKMQHETLVKILTPMAHSFSGVLHDQHHHST